MSVNVVNQTSGAITPTAGIPSAKINGIQDNINKNGAKNLLPNNAVTTTINGVTFTVNSDGSVIANGTATGDAAYLNLYARTDQDTLQLDDGEYVLSTGDLPTGCRIFIGVRNADNTAWLFNVNVTGEYSFNLSNNIGKTNYATLQLRVELGTTVNDVVFYPMIRLATDTDSTYEPYAMTNRELTELTLYNAENGFTPASISGIDNSNIFAYKVGKTVTVRFNLVVTTAPTGWTTLGQLKEGYRPPATLDQYVHTNSNLGLVEIKSNNTSATAGNIEMNGITVGNYYAVITFVVP